MKTMTIYKIAAGVLMVLSGAGILSLVWAIAAFVKLTGLAPCSWLVSFAPLLLMVGLILLLIMLIGLTRKGDILRPTPATACSIC